MLSKMLKTLVPIAALCVIAPAHSATQTWNWSSGSNPLSSNSDGNTISDTTGGVGLTLSAWSDTGGLSGDTDNIVRNAEMVYYGSGIGVINRDESDNVPNHSVDSFSSNDVDLIGLQFTQAVNLSHIDLSWATDGSDSGNGRADMSFAAYNGGGNPASLSSLLNGNTWSSVLAGGFGWANSVADVTTSGGYQAIGSPTDLFSKFWLVSAYNPLFANLSGHGSRNDGFKLSGLYTNTRMAPPNGSAPIPGTMLLMLLGLFTLFRQKNTTSTAQAA